MMGGEVCLFTQGQWEKSFGETGVDGKPAPCLKCSQDTSLNSVNVTESINLC